MEQFIGKCLMRKVTGNDGKPKLMITGVFEPTESFETFHDNDEMWAVRFNVAEVIKFKDYHVPSALHVDQFLSGEGMNPDNWKIKENKISYEL